MTIKFKKLSPTAIPFRYTREHDACMDVFSDEDKLIYPHETVIVNTNIAVKVPISCEGLIRGRSGLASKGIYVHTGTIDEEYTGNIGIIITNHTLDEFKVTKGMRIAQFTVKPVYYLKLEEVDELEKTNRGGNGFGSSGI